jgi:hypothetical protein
MTAVDDSREVDRKCRASLSEGSGARKRASINDLTDASRKGDHVAFVELRRTFEEEQAGEVTEYFFGQHTNTCAALVRQAKEGHAHLSIKLAYEVGRTPPAFDEMIRSLRSEERQARVVLNARECEIVTQEVYTTIVYLLNVLDVVGGQLERSAEEQDRFTDQINTAVESARRELVEVRQFVARSARNSALRWYLIGLPLGVLLGVALTFVMYKAPILVSQSLASNYPMSVSLASGAIGAIVSVMVRITRGQSLDVDINQKRSVTIAAGAFRPIIGSVFGMAFFVLIQGDLLPIAVPELADGKDPLFFFAGLAFLAGFSERWAQDTIVHSAPRAAAGTSPADVN